MRSRNDFFSPPSRTLSCISLVPLSHATLTRTPLSLTPLSLTPLSLARHSLSHATLSRTTLSRTPLRWVFNDAAATIRSEGSDLCFDVHSGSTDEGARVIAYPFHGGANQRFRIQKLMQFYDDRRSSPRPPRIVYATYRA